MATARKPDPVLLPAKRGVDTDQLLALGQRQIILNPAQRRIRSSAIAAAVALHLIVLLAIIFVPRHQPVRVSVAHAGAISAFVNVATPVGTTGVKPAAPKPKPKPAPTAPAVMPTKIADSIADSAGAQQAEAVAQGGPLVRLSMGQVHLIRKVEPEYPAAMIRAHQDGTVVLDAVIHRDGTIGDVKVLQSVNPFFDRAAIDAVKRWQYTPIPYEGVVTVTVKFNLR